MSVRYAVSIILNAHLPYVREFPAVSQREADMLYDSPVFDSQHAASQTPPDSAEQTAFEGQISSENWRWRNLLLKK